MLEMLETSGNVGNVGKGGLETNMTLYTCMNVLSRHAILAGVGTAPAVRKTQARWAQTHNACVVAEKTLWPIWKAYGITTCITPTTYRRTLPQATAIVVDVLAPEYWEPMMHVLMQVAQHVPRLSVRCVTPEEIALVPADAQIITRYAGEMRTHGIARIHPAFEDWLVCHACRNMYRYCQCPWAAHRYSGTSDRYLKMIGSNPYGYRNRLPDDNER